MKSNKKVDRQPPVVIWLDTIQKVWLLLVWMVLFVPGLSLSARAQITGAEGTTVNTNGNTIDITKDVPPVGTNLFHTFGQFNVNTGQTANFVTTPNIVNVLGRINGGSPSTIDGKIQVSGSSANLFLMNPAGMVFGAGASLNVPGSFTATTANAIGFGDGNWFNAFGNNTYTNLTGNPTSLGFTSGAQPGSIFNAANLTTTPGKSITLVGGTVISTGTIKTEGGNITIATVPGGKLVRLSNDGNPLSLDLPMAAADQINANPASFTPLSLPQLLTSSDAVKAIAASGVKVDATTGEVSLVRDSALKIANGDTVTKLNQTISQGDVVTNNLDASSPAPPPAPFDPANPNPTINPNENPFTRANPAKNGGNIQIDSINAILTGELNTSNSSGVYSYTNNELGSGGNGGNVVLRSQTAIKTGQIDTNTNYQNDRVFLKDAPNGRPTDNQIAILLPKGGDITLSTKTGDIIIDSILSRNTLSSAFGAEYYIGRGGDLTVSAAGLFRVVDFAKNSKAYTSIDTSAFGNIKITHGGNDFVVGASVLTRDIDGYKSSLPPTPGFTFPEGASGSLGLIITTVFGNSSIGIVYTGQNISGININSTASTPPGGGGGTPGGGGGGTNPGGGGTNPGGGVGNNPGDGGTNPGGGVGNNPGGGTNPGGGGGTNPGGGVGNNPGGGGTNPGGGVGNNPGGGGTNPGGGVGNNPGGGGTNPGGGVGNNPGGGGTNPGGGVGNNPGGGGTNPGGGVGNNPGGGGTNPGGGVGNNPGGGVGNNPGGGVGNNPGGGTNPGGGVGNNPGGGGTNPGGGVGNNPGGGGTNPGGVGNNPGGGGTNPDGGVANNPGGGGGTNPDGGVGNNPGVGTNPGGDVGNNPGDGGTNPDGTTNAGNNGNGGNGSGTNSDGTGTGTGNNNAGNNGTGTGTDSGSSANNGNGSGTGNGNQDGNGNKDETKTAKDDAEGQSEQKVTKRKNGVQCDRNVNTNVAKAKSDRLKSELTEKPNTSAADPCDPNFNGNAILQILNNKKSK